MSVIYKSGGTSQSEFQISSDRAAHLSGWYAGGSFTRASDSSFTVTDNASNQAAFAKGRPIRYRATSGTWRYGIVTNYSTGTVTLAGAAMTASDDDEIQYGDFSKSVAMEIGTLAGKFAESASTTLLDDNNIWLSWQFGTAYLVRFRVRVGTDDSGASQPRVNMTIGGSAVGTANTNAGLAVAESWVSTVTDINTSNYDIAFGDAIELSTDANGTNDDASGLFVSAVFVEV